MENAGTTQREDLTKLARRFRAAHDMDGVAEHRKAFALTHVLATAWRATSHSVWNGVVHTPDTTTSSVKYRERSSQSIFALDSASVEDFAQYQEGRVDGAG